jgi:hypothetical protein
MNLRPLRTFWTAWLGAGLLALAAGAGAAGSSSPDPLDQRLAAGEVLILPAGAHSGPGQGYRLLYTVEAPIEVFWRFKTDFDNTWVLTNKFIAGHRLVLLEGRRAVTEARYANRPEAVFRWETVLTPESHRLDFRLLNPEECGQRFNFGSIQLSPLGARTKVVHTAHFDFAGAFFWYHYPWAGGMREFLDYTARWEQATVLRWRPHYEAQPPPP